MRKIFVSLVVCGLLSEASVARSNEGSLIVVPLSVRIDVLKKVLEEKVPPSESGSKDNVLGKPATSSRLSWTFDRAPIGLTAGNNALTATTSISGFVRIEGEAQIIRGKIGKILGHLNPTRFSFSSHADLAANATITARPQLQSNWRLAPNISVSADVTEASIPIADVATISVRGEVQPRLDDKLNALVAELNADLAGRTFVEEAARKAWTGLCKAHRIDGPKDAVGTSQPLWVVVEPRAAHALPVDINAERVQLTIGITAETRLTDTEQPPHCIDLPQLTAPPADNGFALSVPVDVSYARIGDELTKAVAGKKLPVGSAGMTVTASSVGVEPSGDRLKVTLDLEVNDGGYLDWIFGGTSGKVTITAKPVLDTAGKMLSVDDIAFEANSDDVFNSAGLAATAATAAKPLITQLLKEKVRLDLATEETKARDKANAAIAALQARDFGGLKIAEAELTGIELDQIAVGTQALGLVITAHGRLGLELTELKLQ